MRFHLAKDKFWKFDIFCGNIWMGYPLLQVDKWVHLLGCAFLFSLFYFGAYHWMGLSLMAAVFGQGYVAAFWALICGFLWEVKDGFRQEGFSWRDLVADSIGIGVLWWIAP